MEKDEINEKATEEMKNEECYKLFQRWFQENGGLVDSRIQFPTGFGDTGYKGVACTEDIPAYEAILAVPNKILVTMQLIQQSAIRQVIKEHPKVFNQEEDIDGDFNQMAVYVLYEMMQKEKSYFYPMFCITKQSFSALSWDAHDIAKLEVLSLQQQIAEQQKNMLEYWNKMQKVLLQHSDLFPPEQYSKELFYNAYEFVQTRHYGRSLPSSMMLVPFGDCVNHNKYGCMPRNFVNTRYEESLICNLKDGLELQQQEVQIKSDVKVVKNESVVPPSYKPHFDKMDLSLFHNEKLMLQPKVKEECLKYENQKVAYILKNMEKLNSQPSIKQTQIQQTFAEDNFKFSIDYNKNDSVQLREYVSEINFRILESEEGQSKQIFHLPFYETTDSEDKEEEDESDEEDEGVNQEQQGLQSLQKQQICTAKQDSHSNKQQLSQFVKKQINDNEENNFNKKLYDKQDQSEKYNWTWYNQADLDTYFVISTERPEQKGNQVYISYGRRSNQYLLQWYGFTQQNNVYDSYSFRIWTLSSKNGENIMETMLENVIYEGHVWETWWEEGIPESALPSTYEQSQDSQNQIQKQLFPDDALTKPFLLKASRLNDDLILYLRILLQPSFEGSQDESIMLTLPSNLDFEIFIFSFYLKIIEYLQNKFLTTLEYDLDIQLHSSAKDYFAHVYRKLQKTILYKQALAVRLVLSILHNIKKGISFREAYLNKQIKEDSHRQAYMQLRLMIKRYLNQFYVGYVKTMQAKLQINPLQK